MHPPRAPLGPYPSVREPRTAWFEFRCSKCQRAFRFRADHPWPAVCPWGCDYRDNDLILQPLGPDRARGR